MSTLKVLTVGVCLVFGLHAADIPAESRAADWASWRDAGRLAMRQRNYTDAVQRFAQCVDLSKTNDERAAALAMYGIALSRVGRNADARDALERAIKAWENEGGASAGDRVALSGVLASVNRNLGDYAGAERLLRTEISDPAARPEDRATLMVNLADILREEAREGEANAVLEEAAGLPGLSPGQQTSLLVEKAEIAREIHHWDESIALWNKVGEIAEAEQSPELEAAFTGGLGETWLASGNLARAEPLLRRSLQLVRHSPGVSPAQVATALELMANLYIDEDKLALAGEALDEAIEKDEMSFGTDHPQVALLLELRAATLARRGEAQAARGDLARARVIMSSHFGSGSAAVAGVLAALGDVEQRDRHQALAVSDYEQAIGLLRAGGNEARLGSGLITRYTAALKAAHLSGKTRPAYVQALLADRTSQSFREK